MADIINMAFKSLGEVFHILRHFLEYPWSYGNVFTMILYKIFFHAIGAHKPLDEIPDSLCPLIRGGGKFFGNPKILYRLTSLRW